jgi:hypothetical protein
MFIMPRRTPKATSANTWSPRERLELFATVANELSETRLVKEEFNFSYQLKVSNTGGQPAATATIVDPPRDDLRALMTIFRKFIADSSPIYINHIFTNYADHLLPDSSANDYDAAWFIEQLQAARIAWNRIMDQGIGQVIYNGIKITMRDALNLSLNGDIIHNDKDKMRFLKELQAALLCQSCHSNIPCIFLRSLTLFSILGSLL